MRSGLATRILLGGAAVAVVAVALALAGDARADAPRDLLANGSFEAGKGAPEGWQRPDGLTSLWVEEGHGGGHCMKFDTDVKLAELHARKAEMERDPPPLARPKSPTKHPDYDTVAGVEGVAFYSDFLEVKPGMRYTLQLSARALKAGMTPKVFVKGYEETHEDVIDGAGKRVNRTFRRVRYKVSLDCKCDLTWNDFQCAVNPTVDGPEVRWVRIMIFCYWPQGTYWVDDVHLLEAGEDPGASERWKSKAQTRAADEKRALEGELEKARETLRIVTRALERYEAETGAYPTTSRGLAALWAAPEGVKRWNGPYLPELDLDPWGSPYRYSWPGKRNPGAYDLSSCGPDGVDGGGDDIEN